MSGTSHHIHTFSTRFDNSTDELAKGPVKPTAGQKFSDLENSDLPDDLFLPSVSEEISNDRKNNSGAVVPIEQIGDGEEDIQATGADSVNALLEKLSPEKMQSVDSIRLYLNDIGHHPLLTAEQEIELSQQIAEGKAAEEALDDESMELSPPERCALKQMVDAGEKARRRLAQSNLRLVVSVAKRYTGRGLSFLDLIQEGSMGLLRAVDKFDHSLGCRFSTYAIWWIRQALSRGISDKGRTIRIPIYLGEILNRHSRVLRELEQEFGRIPNDEEIALEMGFLDEEDVQLVHASIRDGTGLADEVASRLHKAVKKVHQIKRLKTEPVSLQQPIGTYENSEIAELLVDQSAVDPVESASRQMLREQIFQMLSDLSAKERTVLVKRFGLDNGEPCTLEEIGRELSVTRERVRQIEAQALRKLRHPTRSRLLADYAGQAG